MKPKWSVQLLAWVHPTLRERIRRIVKRTKMSHAEVIDFAMSRVPDEDFVKTERQAKLPFGKEKP